MSPASLLAAAGAAALALTGADAARSGGSCTTSSSYDYLLLELQWAITECQDAFSCPTTPRWQFFTLHGLWPEDSASARPGNSASANLAAGDTPLPLLRPAPADDGNYPCTCTNEAFDPSAITRECGRSAPHRGISGRHGSGRAGRRCGGARGCSVLVIRPGRGPAREGRGDGRDRGVAPPAHPPRIDPPTARPTPTRHAHAPARSHPERHGHLLALPERPEPHVLGPRVDEARHRAWRANVAPPAPCARGRAS